mmetsp:Transcript_230/g.521  ORF Transcript_230/g.521 Transcript_230/m.521 type:complete len:538 (+) Transcript_230:61-1674(+)|eukprot:CAMPEP_0206446844 /NCGR_PEP_ID=MMETSP0324_2-20121206/16396_1 /ASSEMBLY_ACC=CAM_ASM_000836 /TAXON_ID=2866 /ORGANISM="Crypthecodinium cohnii, Strain Seligo" /LENGTH=537 /DNA_ID=CAMNT_0053915429 /DNA_START=63 /DNA_END=1676 /DNA_ORIENTATION=+
MPLLLKGVDILNCVPPADRLFAVMHDGSKAITWGQMIEKRDRVAHSILKHLPQLAGGGGSSAIYGKNSVDWLVARQVISVLGLRFSPINWHLVADEIAYIVDDCDADLLFFGHEQLDIVKGFMPQTPKVKLHVAIDGTCPGFKSFEELYNEAPVGAKPPPIVANQSVIFYTGGTTGKPKGACRTFAPPQFKSMEEAFEMKKTNLEEWGADRGLPEPVQLCAAPLYHSLPLGWATMGSTIGSSFVLMKRFDAKQALGAIQRFKVTNMSVPPILLKRFLQVPEEEWKQFDISSIKAMMTGGAACATTIKEGVFKRFGPVLFELYGSSETGGVAIMPPEEMLKRPTSCGKICKAFKVMIVDDNKKQITEPGVAGEIYATGNNISGYHKLEAKTKEACMGEYMTVGDVGYVDKDNFLYISDRMIDMVVSGGVNIYPAQVEEVLNGHPAIEDIAVFGVPDEEYGERVHAAIKFAPGKSAKTEDLLKWADGKIGKFQLPKEGDFSFHSDDFPRSEAGKLRKKALRQTVLDSKDKKSSPPASRL